MNEYILNSTITKSRFYRIIFMVWLGLVILSFFTSVGRADILNITESSFVCSDNPNGIHGGVV